MGAKIKNISSQNLCFNSFRAVNHFLNHPTTVKVRNIVGLILGIGLLAYSPFTISLGIELAVCLAVTGLILITISLIFRRTIVEPEPIANLWDHLNQKTHDQLKDLAYFSENELNHRFSDIRCPKSTAVSIDGYHLHANKVGEGIGKRTLIASQAPLPEDYEAFWKAIFESRSTIIDLTTEKDQTHGGVTKYYPDELNETVNYGSMTVKLIEADMNTHTYEVENGQSGVIIKRYNYKEWKDFGAVSSHELNNLVKQVKQLSPNAAWIHCRAGVGRTGTLITALALKEKIKRGEITRKNLDTSLVDLIISLRKQRGPAFVQQEAQLDLLRQYGHSLIA